MSAFHASKPDPNQASGSSDVTQEALSHPARARPGERVNHARAAAKFLRAKEHARSHNERVWAMRTQRDAAVHEIDEWEELRELASGIKNHVLAHLDDYLQEFEANAEANGIHVHWAKTAAAYNRIVHGIFSDHDVKLVVKSKSMLMEECGFQDYMDGQGIEIIETDLGERIQQLKGEISSHVVVPSVHQLRADVARLFADEFGSDPDSDDAQYLARQQREATRPLFLKADAGMTGANFAVAESGGFVVCTNEGNADLSANAPDLHVAAIGIEKLIPRVEDLGVFIRMLSRSALGSPITQYTTHFRGPKRGGEMHVVLVDNGRSERLGMARFWSALKCIRCSACMNTCPVFRLGSGLAYGATYAGPLGIMLQPAMDKHRYANLPYASTLNGSCTEVCPVKINIHEQIFEWRRVLAEEGELPLHKRAGLAAAGRILARPKAYRAALKSGYAALRYLPNWLLYNRLNTWGRERDLPQPPPGGSFHDWYRDHRLRQGEGSNNE